MGASTGKTVRFRLKRWVIRLRWRVEFGEHRSLVLAALKPASLRRSVASPLRRFRKMSAHAGCRIVVSVE